MKKLIAAVVVGLMLFSAAPAQAYTKITNKQKNSYWAAVKKIEPSVTVIGKKGIVSLGLTTCKTLRNGATLQDLIEVMLDTEDFYLIEDMAYASIAAAPVYLCRDQQYKFN
jgi:hypothetical protein